MATEDLGKALIPQSSFDSCFASNKVGGSGRVQDTGVPTVFRDPIFSPVASPGRSSPDQIIRIDTMLMVKIKSLQKLR